MVFSIQLSSYKLIDHLQATVKKKGKTEKQEKNTVTEQVNHFDFIRQIWSALKREKICV